MLLSHRPYLKRSRGVPARRPDTISCEQERVVMERELEALKRTAGARPMGYPPACSDATRREATGRARGYFHIYINMI